MDDIVKAGVRTKVLLLSATPVNNDLKDLRNQLYFLTEGKDDAFAESIGISSLNPDIVPNRDFHNRAGSCYRAKSGIHWISFFILARDLRPSDSFRRRSPAGYGFAAVFVADRSYIVD
jgi:hypothetical protein